LLIPSLLFLFEVVLFELFAAKYGFLRSSLANKITSAYDSVEAALADIQNNTYKLSDFDKESGYLSYAQLQDKMKYVTFDGVTSQTNSQTLGDSAVAQVAQVASVQPVEIKAGETAAPN
jgi:hypothetical protein